jgi:hypothetical protein
MMWKNIVKPDRQHMTMWCVHTGCWIIKATHTHTLSLSLSEYVIPTAIPLQKWLHECNSLLHYMHPTFPVTDENQ